MQKPPPKEDLVAKLEQFAQHLADVLKKTGSDWRANSDEGEWSLTEVVCHLRDVEREVHQARIAAIIQQDEPFLPGVVTDAWVEKRRYNEQHGTHALHAFVVARGETVELLASLDDRMWGRWGQHAFLGSTSLHELVYLIVQHDEAHWQQLIRLLAA